MCRGRQRDAFAGASGSPADPGSRPFEVRWRPLIPTRELPGHAGGIVLGMSLVIGLSPRRRKSSRWQHLPSLLASLAPGIAFGLGLLALSRSARFAWVRSLGAWHGELWVIFSAGSV